MNMGALSSGFNNIHTSFNNKGGMRNTFTTITSS